jgi:hypothetical protein
VHQSLKHTWQSILYMKYLFDLTAQANILHLNEIVSLFHRLRTGSEKTMGATVAGKGTEPAVDER